MWPNFLNSPPEVSVVKICIHSYLQSVLLPSEFLTILCAYKTHQDSAGCSEWRRWTHYWWGLRQLCLCSRHVSACAYFHSLRGMYRGPKSYWRLLPPTLQWSPECLTGTRHTEDGLSPRLSHRQAVTEARHTDFLQVSFLLLHLKINKPNC